MAARVLQLVALLGALAVCGAQRQRMTVPAPAAASASGVQASGMEFEVSASSVSILNVRLAGARVAAVRFLPSSDDVEAALAQRSPATIDLDWEQQYSSGGGFSVVATLPDEASRGAVSQVVAYSEGCSGYSGILAVGRVRPGVEAATGGTVAVVVDAVGVLSQADSASHSRQLKQSFTTPSPSPLPSCTLEVGSNSLRFDGCLALRTTPPAQYQVYYSLEPNGSGGTRYVGGLKVDAAAFGGQWAGFGFPQSPAVMIGTSAIIVKECKTCPSGASVDGYKLVGYTPSDNVAGSYTITNASAAKAADGALVASFTADLPQPPEELLGSPFNIVFSIGPLAPDESLLAHPGVGPYGGKSLMLASGMGSAAPAPAPVAPDPEPAAQAPSTGAEPVAPAAEAPAPAPSASPAAPTCLLGLGGQQVTFGACTPVQGIGNDYTLMWTLDDGNTSASVLQLGLRAAAGGWVAVGFPTSPGLMLGATAMILKTCPSCPTGASIEDYYLAGRTSEGVQPPGRLSVSEPLAVLNGDGTMEGTIKVRLDAAAAINPNFPINVAAGPVDSSNGLLQHDDRGSTTANWAAGTSSTVQGESSHVASLKAAHGWLMAIGWGLLIPLGILVARHGKGVKPPLWFQVHRAIQVLGLSCALSGFIIIFVAVKQATGTSVSTYTTHRNLGISAMSLGFFQLTALLLRPHKGSKLRRYWEPAHHWVGRAAALVAAANIYEGIINVRSVGTWAVATYSVIFGLILATHLGLDAYKLLTGRGLGGEPSQPTWWANQLGGQRKEQQGGKGDEADSMADGPPRSSGLGTESSSEHGGFKAAP